VVATVYNDAGNTVAMTTNPLGCRCYDDVRTVLQWFEQITTTTKCVVHNKGKVVFLGNSRDAVEIGNAEAGIAYRFYVNGFGFFIDCSFDIFGGFVLCKPCLDTEPLERNLKLVIRAAI